MAILILEPDVNGRAQASIQESVARHAEVGRLLTHVKHHLDMPLLQNPQDEPLPCREPVQETAAVSAHFSAQLHALCEQHCPRCRFALAAVLPSLPFVRKLRIVQSAGPLQDFHFSRVRPVSLRVPLECLVHLPRWLPVPAVGRPMRHFTRVWEGPWRDARHEFGAAVMESRTSCWPKLLACEDDQALAMPDLVAPARQDPLSVGLRALAARLQELDLRAFVTKHLFPAPGDATQWSRIWYFVGPRGEDPHPEGFVISGVDHYPPLQATAEDEEGGEEIDAFPDVFRTEQLAERIEPLLAAFASAYPSESRADDYGDEAPYDCENGVHRWGVRYLAGGSGDEGGAEAVVRWQVGDWRPSRGVLDLFEELGRQEWLDFAFEHERNMKPHTVAPE
ncbi:hypothetical protein N658DRAFT_563829 [Parathielavia hyrcaniae]|uniref:Uncharacterized protein n=1 Tax=Parathielavia hyrcaniae TaxID=113614 RepID=A0AAN6QBU3_9PEZI|nr:hypothetical protein N658DRAFT_563829 [Parathielavia hyrcaniae]